MGEIISISEEGRQRTHLLGASPVFTRTFKVLLTSSISARDLLAQCGVLLGSRHPEFAAAQVVSTEVEERLIEQEDIGSELPAPPPEILGSEGGRPPSGPFLPEPPPNEETGGESPGDVEEEAPSPPEDD
jgi:hypothetical protein